MMEVSYAPPVTSVVLVDPCPLVRLGLRAMLAALPGLRVVGEAADGPSAVALVAELDPDVVISEASLPGLGFGNLLPRLLAARPARMVFILTECADPVTVRAILAAGASGYALKSLGAAELVRAMCLVARGGNYVDPSVADSPAAPDLSAREDQVLKMIARGHSNADIAARLGLSVKSVEKYKTRAWEKTGIRCRVQLVSYAIRRGWLSEDVFDGGGIQTKVNEAAVA